MKRLTVLQQAEMSWVSAETRKRENTHITHSSVID